MLLMSASLKLSHQQQFVETFQKLGYQESLLTPIGVLEIFCALVFLVPATGVLGAILVTGYLGGAVASHVRAGEGFAAPLLLGMLAWAGLFLRDERIRAILPLRKKT